MIKALTDGPPRLSIWMNRAMVGGGFRQIESVKPFKSDDPDSERILWQEGGVHQNLTFPVHPDPVSGMHCWHQRVRVERAESDDKYGDVVVDTKASHEMYRQVARDDSPCPWPGWIASPALVLAPSETR